MGNEHSKTSIAKRELLKLSWRIVLCVQRKSTSTRNSTRASHASTLSVGGVDQDYDFVTEAIVRGQKCFKPFNKDFQNLFFQYCPDLSEKFPKDSLMVSKFIQTFISDVVEGRKNDKLTEMFVAQKFQLKQAHFEGFAQALVDCVQERLGKYGTIELIRVWEKVAKSMASKLYKDYRYIKDRRHRAQAQVQQFMAQKYKKGKD
mmetsp:Transcript_18758/g.26148  ORF Transcript_18758/g.26148 Transcript_18758/m.26148 type:complete len:203 (+) Transcript_18758:45-653(+)